MVLLNGLTEKVETHNVRGRCLWEN